MTRLQDQLLNHGFGTPPIVLDGVLRRFVPEGGKKPTGWIACNENHDSVVCVAGDWKTDKKVTVFEPKSGSHTTKPKANYEVERQIQKIASALKTRTRNLDAQESVHSVWNNATPCKTHPYLRRKKESDGDLRVDNYGNLVVPMFDTKGEHWNNQRINCHGSKFFSKGARVKECFYPIGSLVNGMTFVICEGSATGLTIQRITGYTAIVAFTADNLLLVGKAIRKKYPDSKLIYAADDDRYSPVNIGKLKATIAAKATDGIVVLPRFTCTKTKPTDFNDLYTLEGRSAVNSQFLEVTYGK